MTIDPRKRQKRMAEKARKRKAKAKQLKGQASSLYPLSDLSRAPIHEAMVPEEIFENGLGNVILSRHIGSGNLALSVFLVDVYCLGIKDATFTVLKKSDYDYQTDRFYGEHSFMSVEAAFVRKLVEGAVDYAGQFGFKPHKDYRKAKRIFGDIDPNECAREFEYGYEGKPLFISGPNDSPEKCQRIMDTLTERLGPDGFHFMIEEPGSWDLR